MAKKKTIAITLSLMLTMSLSACESKPTMHVSDETEAVESVVDVVPEVITTAEVTAVPETSTTTEETTIPPKDYAIELPETIDIKIYFYTDIYNDDYYYDENYNYKIAYIPKENFLQEAVEALNLYEKSNINEIWYEEERLCVGFNDFSPHFVWGGSHGAQIETMALLKTFSSFPNVSEVSFQIIGENIIAQDSYFPPNGYWKVNGTSLEDIHFVEYDD